MQFSKQPDVLPKDLEALYSELPKNEMAGNEELRALNLPSSSLTSCYYYADMGHENDENFTQEE